MTSRKSVNHSKEVFVVDGARTPFLKMRGVPGPFSAADLGVSAARALLAKQPFSPDAFDEVIVGCAGPSEDEANIARIIALRSGCGKKMSAYTVQRNCASGLQSIDNAARGIALGRSQLVLAGGTEAMSRAPLLYNKAMVLWLSKLNQAKSPAQKLQRILKFRPNFLVPVIALLKGLTDPVVNMNMGQTAEELAYLFNITRTQMDEYAASSHLRALAAKEAGLLDEISPLYAQDGTVYEVDDGVRTDSTVERLAKLKPVFDKYGSITAGNSSQISDGAAFVVLASEEAVDRYQLPVLAKIVDTHFAGLDPTIMGLGPIHAMTPILQRNELTLNDIDHMEINEAFAAQVIGCVRAWEDDKYCKEALGLKEALGAVDMAKLNPNGGAIAMGHPVGASGARLVLHAANMLVKNQTKRALASLCIGGGQGGAILLERVGA